MAIQSQCKYQVYQSHKVLQKVRQIHDRRDVGHLEQPKQPQRAEVHEHLCGLSVRAVRKVVDRDRGQDVDEHLLFEVANHDLSRVHDLLRNHFVDERRPHFDENVDDEHQVDQHVELVPALRELELRLEGNEVRSHEAVEGCGGHNENFPPHSPLIA